MPGPPFSLLKPSRIGRRARSAALPRLRLPANADVIYSGPSEGVQPPVWKHPKLPPFELVDSRVSGTNTMELLVDESGDVRHVQLVTTPVRMSDMLLLSNAKTWKFYPAIKDGSPVKYRLAMSWNVTPR